MAVDYAEMMQSGRPDDTAAAKAPVVSFERVKPKRLTKKTGSALLKKRNAEKKTMAKKRRTAKQIAATKKMIAANRRARNKSKRGSTKRARVSGRRAQAVAYVTAREPSTAIVKYEEPKRVTVTKKKSKSKGKRGKRRTAKQKAATKKMIAANKRRSSGKTKRKTPRSSPKRATASKSRTSGKRRAKAVIVVSAGENRKRSSRRRPHHRRGAMENPLTGVELFIGTLTGLMGFGTADVVDRIIATHALTGVTSGTVTAYTDVPPTASPAQGTKATYGSLFNSTAVCAPMNITRWLAGLGISGAPILIGHFISAPVGRSALQFFGFGALMRVAGKGLIDVVAALSKSNMTGMRLYSGEQRAAAVLANDGTAAQLPAQAMTGLGRARIAGSLGQPPTLKMHQAGCGCGNCKGQQPGAGYPSMPAPQMTTPPPAPQPNAPIQSAAPPPVANTTVDQNIAIRGIPSGFQPRPGMFDWGHKAA